MSAHSTSLAEEGSPRYLAPGEPGFDDYFPAWLGDLADDVTIEGSMLRGAAQGPDAVRAIVGTFRDIYGDSLQFHFAGPWTDDVWIEDYIARIDDKPLGCLVLVTRNAAGQTQQVVASYRPLDTVIHFSRLLHAKLADTPYAKYFLDEEA